MNLAQVIDAVPVVQSVADRGAKFPSPLVDQQVFNKGTGNVERWTGAAWVVEFTSQTAAAALGWFNVRDTAYAAVGDGVANDGTAIRAAIAACNITGSLTGGFVYFPNGKYMYTGTLTVPIALNQGQVILLGEGMRSTYLYPSGASTTFTAAPLYNVCLLFGSTSPDVAGASTQNTQYCGMEDISLSGSLLTTGSVVGVQFTQMQKGWITNHITEGLPNNSIGLYLRGSTVTGGLGTSTTAPHTWRCSFSNVVCTVGSNNLGGRPLILQNADENYFENCVLGATPGQTVGVRSIFTTWIQLGRNNLFDDCLQAGDRTALKTGYVGTVFGPPQNEAGVANGSVLGNVDFGSVAEGFDVCCWFKGDASGNTLGNQVLAANPSIFNTAYLDDTPALTNGGLVGGGNGGNIYEAPLISIMYRAIASPSMPTCIFANGATTPTVGGSDAWVTANAGPTIILDFLAPSGASLDGRPLWVRFGDANTTIRDVNNGGGGHIRCWGRQDIVGAVDQVVGFRNFAGVWYQCTPVMTVNLTTPFAVPTQLTSAIKLQSFGVFYAVPNVIFRDAGKTTSSTSDASITSKSLDASALATTNQAVRITARGRQATQAGSFNIKFGATVIATVTLAAGENWEFECTVTRTGAATQLANGRTIHGTTVAVIAAQPAETLSGAITIDFRGSVTAGGTLSLDQVMIEHEGV